MLFRSESEIAQTDHPALIQKGLVLLWVVPGVHIKGQKGAHHGTEISGVGEGLGHPWKLDEGNGHRGVQGKI